MSTGDRLLFLIVCAVSWIELAAWSTAQGTPSPRPGLTAQQTKDAVKAVQGVWQKLRNEGQIKPRSERREYIVGVELVSTKPGETAAEAPNANPGENSGGSEKNAAATPGRAGPSSGPLALVTSYRYDDDMTIFWTVNLGTGRVVRSETAQHLRTPLSDLEYEEAKALAKEKSDEVKALYEKFGPKLGVAPQFSQFRNKDDPKIHRVVHLTYRVGTKELSYPRPRVDLTTRQVTTPAPEDFAKPRGPR
jgi:hypothetical protein